MNENMPNLSNDKIHFLCIGTDRSTGDSLGPMVGTYLKQMGFENVTGTIDEPCHAVNLSEQAAAIPKDKVVIAIDACLGSASNVGTVSYSKGSLSPGAGVGRDLGEYGDFKIKGIVNVGGFMEYFVLQNTRLSLVMKMAQQIVSRISELYLPSLQIASGEGVNDHE